MKGGSELKNLKNAAFGFIFPPPALFILLIPLSVALLVYTFVFDKSSVGISTFSYLVSAYTLMCVCFRIPDLVRFCKHVHDTNVLINRLFHDPFLQIKISLYGSLIINTGYSIFQLGLGFYYSSIWFCSVAAYYIALAVMRFFLLKDVRGFTPGEDQETELLRFRFCGVGLLSITVTLAVIVFYIVYTDEGFHYNKLITLAMLIYTVCALIVAIVNCIRYRKYKSPVCSAAKAISLAVASISVLTLESAIIYAFGDETAMASKIYVTGITGLCVWAFVLGVAIYMILKANYKLRKLRKKLALQNIKSD